MGEEANSVSEAKGLWKVARDWSGRIRLDQGNGLSVETWRPEIAERIVTDHNALAGIADPAAFVANVLTLLDAVDVSLDKGPCSDPDCCQTAMEHASAREGLRQDAAAVRSAMQSEGK